MRVRTADMLLMENSKEIYVLNATKLIGNVLNVDSSLQLQCLRIHAHNAMKSAIFLMLLAIPRNAEAQDILIQGYRGESIFFALAYPPGRLETKCKYRLFKAPHLDQLENLSAVPAPKGPYMPNMPFLIPVSNCRIFQYRSTQQNL